MVLTAVYTKGLAKIFIIGDNYVLRFSILHCTIYILG